MAVTVGHRTCEQQPHAHIASDRTCWAVPVPGVTPPRFTVPRWRASPGWQSAEPSVSQLVAGGCGEALEWTCSTERVRPPKLPGARRP